MRKPTQIYIDDGGKVHVSYPCDSCSEWVNTEDFCGYGEDYLCCDCFVPATLPEDDEVCRKMEAREKLEEMYIHDWLIMLVDFDWTRDVRVAIHKDVINPEHSCDVDHSSPDPEDDISRFGPGTCAMSMQEINALHHDVNSVYCLVDSGLIDGKKAHLIFQAPDLLTQPKLMVELMESLGECLHAIKIILRKDGSDEGFDFLDFMRGAAKVAEDRLETAERQGGE